MMLTVHGLPNKTKFQDVKALIKQECNIPDFILDNLVEDGYDSKKVRIGLTNENDGYRLMKCLEGFRMSGSHVLKVVPVGKTPQQQPTFEPRSNYSNQSRNDYPNQSHSYGNQNDYNRPNTVNPPSHNSPHGIRNMGSDNRHNDRSMLDVRQSQINQSQEHRHHYQGTGDRHLDNRGPQDTRSEFRDPNRGPLMPPTMRPESLNARVQDNVRSTDHMGIRGSDKPDIRGSDRPGIRSDGPGMRGPDAPIRGQDGPSMRGPDRSVMRGQDGPGMRGQNAPIMRGQNAPIMRGQNNPVMRADAPGMRGPDGPGYQKPDHRQISNPETINHQPQWTTNNEQWSASGYNFQQTQENARYGQQQNTGAQAGVPSSRAPQSQGYLPQKPVLAPERAALRSLRSVEVIDTPLAPRAPAGYPHTQKPITIMKDNFQGPSQYGAGQPSQAPYQGQDPQPWAEQAHVPKPYDKYADRLGVDKPLPKGGQDYDKRRFSPHRGRPASPGRRSPPRNIPPTMRPQPYPERRTSPRPFNRASPPRHTASSRFSPRREISPSKLERKMSPRRISPTRRLASPTRRVSPFGRNKSPRRHISPRKTSPSKVAPRRISPFGRKASPQRRISPYGRKVSPAGPRRVSPFGRKISPKRDERRMSPSMMKHGYYVEDDRKTGGRPGSPRRYSPKRDRGDERRGTGRYSPSDAYEDARGAKPIHPAYEAKQAQKYTDAGFRGNESQYPARNEPKISPWQNEKIVYPLKEEARMPNALEDARKKLSPRLSRSRSPVKDRFRRHSPSPRSPRRSWALEKRRSPDMREPPPPPLWPGQEEKPNTPVWDRNVPERFDDKRRNEDKFSGHTPRFSPRRETDEYNKFDEYQEKRYGKSPHRDEKKLFTEVDKDFNDIYQRAVEFRRKTEELRKSNDRRNRPYDEPERRRDERSPLHAADKPKPNWMPITEPSKEIIRDADRKHIRLDLEVKEKRDKAAEEIATRILESHNFTGDQRVRVMEELKFSIFNIMLEMFKDKDVSYIELVIKFRARYDIKDEEKILHDVLSSMPSHYKNMLKRKGEGITAGPAKIARPSEEKCRPKLADSVIPDWKVPIDPPKVLNLPLTAAPIVPLASVVNEPMITQQPVYVPIPQMYHQNLPMPMQSHMQPDFEANMQEIQSRMQSHIRSNMLEAELAKVDSMHSDMGHDLYLCQDDFETFSENQAEKLRNFLVAQMFKTSEISNGWAPDFAFKGLNSMYRYEVSTKDEQSKIWLQNLDFSDFEFFNVLVYTKEQLWYERAAIWLPGHSRYRNIEPLEKLRLQNHKVEGINIGKWKFVKKIVTTNGTRLYVDMPPSSARALEKKKMMLSYELGKVNVYLKAVAVDKEVFDAGLKAHSITDPVLLASAVQNTAMPIVNVHEPGLVKVSLKGSKTLSLVQAGKIKEMIVYNLFKYHEKVGRLRTDFLKHGFCHPNCVGLVPENNESKRWLMGQNFGKLNKQTIVVAEGDEPNTRYFKMIIGANHRLHDVLTLDPQRIKDVLRYSNQGEKGLNFQYWKIKCVNGFVEIDMDLESVETLIKLNFTLDVTSGKNYKSRVILKSDYSLSKLQEKIRRFKAEQMDSYDVANMDLGSDSD